MSDELNEAGVGESNEERTPPSAVDALRRARREMVSAGETPEMRFQFQLARAQVLALSELTDAITAGKD
jgi:hypothetical protein